MCPIALVRSNDATFCQLDCPSNYSKQTSWVHDTNLLNKAYQSVSKQKPVVISVNSNIRKHGQPQGGCCPNWDHFNNLCTISAACDHSRARPTPYFQHWN